MLPPNSYSKVAVLPSCDICGADARFDAKTVSDIWVKMCPLHFQKLGAGVGLGRGHMLVLYDPPEAAQIRKCPNCDADLDLNDSYQRHESFEGSKSVVTWRFAFNLNCSGCGVLGKTIAEDVFATLETPAFLQNVSADERRA